MRPLYIFDLDGTLALIEHRRHFVECERAKQDWRAFYAACVDDVPNTPVIHVLAALHLCADVRIWTGRSDEVRAQTVEWLATQTKLLRGRLEVEPGSLLMRPENDRRPDYVLKREWLDCLPFDDRMRLVAAFEDRTRVVEMWRQAGVTCFQVAPGEF